jgi:predicted SprT family Zn-dependent metalloprotease
MSRERKRRHQAKTRQPTAEQMDAYQKGWGYYNEKLFDGKLEQPLLSHSRHRGAKGFFNPLAYFDRRYWEMSEEERAEWKAAGGERLATSEISLNPDHISGRSAAEVYSTLVHEQVHQWQFMFGKPSRRGYHNRQWANKMKEVGLQPVACDGSGKETGQSCSHTIITGGPFDRAFNQMPPEFILPWGGLPQVEVKRKPKKSSQKRVRKRCPVCEVEVWLRPENAEHDIECEACGERFLTGAELRQWKKENQ